MAVPPLDAAGVRDKEVPKVHGASDSATELQPSPFVLRFRGFGNNILCSPEIGQ